ncbi:DUF4258 domain-containing protein [Mariniradius sediminis]|nr:DUF4258 domain-containing protein [Mariniradius sediminis]
MKCKNIKYAEHAVVQMFKRNISTFEIEHTISGGQIIKNYLDDKPYPSVLMIGVLDDKIIHVVVAHNSDKEECIVITAYLPDPEIWNKDFKSKK